MSHFISMFLLAAALTLTLCFGLAAWRLTAGDNVDVTGAIPHVEYGWRAKPTD